MDRPLPSGIAIGPDSDTPTASTGAWLCTVHYWAFRAGAFLVLNVLDDPAWLALIFC